ARAADERVDRTMISAEQVAAVFANLARLRAAGLYREALAYHDLASLRVAIGWDHEIKPTDVIVKLEGGSPAPFPDIRTAAATDPQTGPLVQWETPIP